MSVAGEKGVGGGAREFGYVGYNSDVVEGEMKICDSELLVAFYFYMNK